MFTKLVLKNKYKNYESALTHLNLEKLELRRNHLELKFAEQCIKNNKLKNLFPENKMKTMERRHTEKKEN